MENKKPGVSPGFEHIIMIRMVNQAFISLLIFSTEISL